MANPDEPRRVRWSVPRVDVSTNQWLDMQENISRSVQLLIRESIQRDGYIDVVNRPVEQLPRRGRPPGDGKEQSLPLPSVSPGTGGAALEVQSDARPQGHERSDQPEPTATAPSNEAPQVATSHEAKPSDEGLLDMDSIFSKRR